MSAKHSLSAKDKAALTADCTVCGPGAKIAKAGRYGFVCVVARREARKRWRQAHPERARQDRRAPHSKHFLTLQASGQDVCSVCGPVEIVAWGRGWMCANLLAEKKWTSTQTEPAPKCGTCSVWLVDGECPRCKPEPPVRELPDWLYEDILAAGMHLETSETRLPDGSDSVVRGWKTLGSSLPVSEQKVRPEYAVLYGSGRRG